MVGVCQAAAIHLRAAAGYLETGAKANVFDSDLDCHIVREA